MIDGAKPAEQVAEFLVGKQQSVAAGKKHVAHLGVLLQVIDGAVEIKLQLLLADAADHPAARAVPAVGSAPVSDQKKNAVRIAMHQPGHGHVVVLSAGIGHVGRRIGHLLDARNHLSPDRAGRIERIDEVEEIGRDAHRQLGIGKQHARVLLAGELELAGKVVQRLHAVAHLPLPVVPLFGGRVTPPALAG